MSPGNREVTTKHCETAVACEMRELLDRLSDRWSLLVVELLSRRMYRFSELHREIDGISKRILTSSLRLLERDGLVRRTVYAVVPPHVEYELTPIGATLLDSMKPLLDWNREHREAVEAARADFDHRLEKPVRA